MSSICLIITQPALRSFLLVSLKSLRSPGCTVSCLCFIFQATTEATPVKAFDLYHATQS